MPSLSRERLLPPVAAGVLIWSVAVLRLGVDAALGGRSALAAVLPSLPPLLYWLALLPLILRLGAALPLRRDRLGRTLTGHLASGAVLAGVYATLMTGVLPRAWEAVLPWSRWPASSWEIRFQFGLLSYGCVLAWGYVHEYFTAVRARDLAVARLETELVQAQLRALKAQLQPHFLFNTLHAITVLIRRDADAAIAMVLRLSDLLRLTLVDAERQEAPLADELQFLRLYLEIEQTRFRERLRVVWSVPAELERAAVPTLLLQPLVENAIRHGIEASPAGGRVAISAERAADRLRLRVANDGTGLRPAHGRPGVGLAAVRGRLAKLYGEAHAFALEAAAGGEVVATVEVPWRPFTPEPRHA